MKYSFRDPIGVGTETDRVDSSGSGPSLEIGCFLQGWRGLMLGRLLSRVRIQTQVMLFIIPFILSIMAVGATGFYASSLLQGRMDISNSVLQSLSGFRNLSAAMAEFLANAT
nr:MULTISPECIES: TMEM199/VMA12 family vacuolar ATPase assembly factor [unclassified Rhizobium]